MHALRERRAAAVWPADYGLGRTRASSILVVLVVVAMFAERYGRDWYLQGKLPVPEVAFLLAVGALGIALVNRSPAELLRPAPLGRREFMAVVFIAILGVLDVISTAALPPSMSDAHQTLKTYVHIVALLVTAIMLGRALARGNLKLALQAYFYVAVIGALLAIAQAVDLNVASFGLTSHLSLYHRVTGSFDIPVSFYSEPANLGYFSLGGAVIGALVVAPERRLVGPLGAAVCAAGVLLSTSAGALLALVAVVIYLVGTRVGTRVRASSGLNWKTTLVIGVTLVLVLVSPARSVIVNRTEGIVTGTDASAQYRRALDRASIKIWEQAPFSGVGLGNSRIYLPRYVKVSFLPGLSAQFQDASTYLGLLGESGPIAVAAILLTIAVALRRTDPPTNPALEHATVILLLIVAASFLVIGGMFLPPLWFALALRFALERGALARELA